MTTCLPLVIMDDGTWYVLWC